MQKCASNSGFASLFSAGKRNDMNDHIQVETKHYFRPRYLHKERWVNYWYQLNAIFESKADRILEIGVGNGVVLDTLRKVGLHVETVDIDPSLTPDIVASAVQLPVEAEAYDFVLCAEVLEHLPFEDSKKALVEIHRITSNWALITLPYSGSCITLSSKIPLLKKQEWTLKIPHFWMDHTFDGQHYWEVGKKGYSKSTIRRVAEESGFRVRQMKTHADDPSHIFILLQKSSLNS